LVGVRIKEEPERAAFAFFAWRFSFSGLLAAVFEPGEQASQAIR
jgi:hypothetical protein